MSARNATLIHAPKVLDGEEQDTALLALFPLLFHLRGGKAGEQEGGAGDMKESESEVK